jgi:hypothetical protein
MSKTRAEPAKDARNLVELVRDFRKRLGPEGPLEDGYLAWMRQSPDLDTAIDRAVRSRKPTGKMHNHQSRVPLTYLLTFGRRLKASWVHCESFHDLLLYCQRVAQVGIGPVTQYDVAQRIGAFLGLEPEYVYLHAGVKQGAEALGISTKGKGHLTKSELPLALRPLTADECEDFLCVYRALFPKIKQKEKR